MKATIKNIAPVALSLGVVAVGVLLFLSVAHANPGIFGQPSKTAAATTTLAYMTGGAATSTPLVYDSAEQNGTNQTNNGNSFVPSQAMLLLNFQASSSNSTLNINVEYSQDGVDWYADSAANIQGFASTTSLGAGLNVGMGIQYQWQFASSTIGGVNASSTQSLFGVAGTNNRDHRAILLKVPTRYIRVILSLKAGQTNGNGAVWGQIVPTKELR